MALANGYQPATALFLPFYAKFALAFAQGVTIGGGDYKRVAESLHVPPCLKASPLAQQIICKFTVNQPKANALHSKREFTCDMTYKMKTKKLIATDEF